MFIVTIWGILGRFIVMIGVFFRWRVRGLFGVLVLVRLILIL